MYLRDPVNFFMQRFTGMTRPVADVFASRIFCILDDHGDDSRRMTASEFGAWARSLPSLLTGHSMQRTVSNSSTQGHPISASIPISHRPSSRHPSSNAITVRTPGMASRSLSRAPSLGPAYEREEKSELSTVLDHEDEDEDLDDMDFEMEGTTSRSTSTNKRRKRGVRKGKGASVPTTDETLVTLAVASQSLAREISRASRSSHRSPTDALSFDPPTEAIPSLLGKSRTASHGTTTNVPPSPAPVQPVKKPSKWKLSFGKNNAAAAALAANVGNISPVEEVSPPASVDGHHQAMSATASNVTNLLMGLNAPAVHPPPLPSSGRFDDSSSTWNRGRRGRGGATPSLKDRSKSPGYPLSTSSHSGNEPWSFPDKTSERAISPHSTRSGRPLASSASSMVSNNWRSSMSTTSSAGTSTSAFTRYSNSSTRSISTTATSVSSASWRTSVKSSHPTVSGKNGYTTVPRNIKRMFLLFLFNLFLTLSDSHGWCSLGT